MHVICVGGIDGPNTQKSTCYWCRSGFQVIQTNGRQSGRKEISGFVEKGYNLIIAGRESIDYNDEWFQE